MSISEVYAIFDVSGAPGDASRLLGIFTDEAEARRVATDLAKVKATHEGIEYTDDIADCLVFVVKITLNRVLDELI